MNIEFEFPLNENKDIVFRLDRQCSHLFEIAKLKANNESYAYNAVRFRVEKLKELHDLLTLGLNTPKSEIPIRTTKINGTQVKILNYFGTFNAEYKNYQFMYTDWDCSEKYDFHTWHADYTQCEKGIRLTEEECSELLTALKFLLRFENMKK